MHKVTAFLSGALLGASVAAAAVILLTPLSGPELKEQAREWVDQLWRDARRAADDRRFELETQLAALKSGQPLPPKPPAPPA